MLFAKPGDVFDREEEWERLVGFLTGPQQGARLALVSGRRRQGKTLLLEAAREVTDGFYWQAREQSTVQNLTELAAAIAAFTGAPTPPRLQSWEDAVATLVSMRRPGDDRPLPVLLDEIGYLVASAPELPSILQAHLSPRGAARRNGRARIVLCGSAFGLMRRLLDPGAPLRGRADLDLVLRPFDERTSARFWGLSANPDAAFRLHALVGGTPAHRDLAGADLPVDGDIDRWVVRTLLDHGSPLFREGRLVVGEDPTLADKQLYWSLLGAIADGHHDRIAITTALGRPSTSLGHALQTVQEAGWVVHERDPLRDRGGSYDIDEPLVRLHRLVIEPNEARLLRRTSATDVWNDAQPLVRSRIYGPHLEHLARSWIRTWASPGTVGGIPGLVGPSQLTVGRQRVQLDIAAVETTPSGGRSLCAIGEVKASTRPVGRDELDRLDEIADRLRRHLDKVRVPAGGPKLLLVSRAGFTTELERLARSRGEVELVDLHRLYQGV